MKYINADKLLAVLERQNVDKKVIQPLIRIIESLQQEMWKPSEEQMKEYGYWYRNFIESGLASPTSKAVTVLGELLEQLKKL